MLAVMIPTFKCNIFGKIILKLNNVKDTHRTWNKSKNTNNNNIYLMKWKFLCYARLAKHNAHARSRHNAQFAKTKKKVNKVIQNFELSPLNGTLGFFVLFSLFFFPRLNEPMTLNSCEHMVQAFNLYYTQSWLQKQILFVSFSLFSCVVGCCCCCRLVFSQLLAAALFFCLFFSDFMCEWICIHVSHSFIIILMLFLSSSSSL